jgi:MFS family permease
MPPGFEPNTQATRAVRNAPTSVAFGLFAVYATLFVALAAVSVIYLPSRVAELAPDDKIGALAIVTTISALAVMLAQPVIGALSDRTRSPVGRRAPWMLAGAAAAAVLVPLLGIAGGVVVLGLVWAGTELALNVVLAPAAASTVDRVPERRRGLIAGVTGLGFLAGSAVGASVVGVLMLAGGAGVWVAALVPLAGVIVFVVLNPERRAPAPAAREPRAEAVPLGRRIADAVRTLARHPDFAWAFLSRLLIAMAHTVLVTYLLYIAEDHLGLEPDAAARLAGLVVVVILGASAPTLLLGGLLSDRTGRRRWVVAISASAMAAALLIPMLAPGPTAMLVFAGVFGVAYGAYSSSAKALNTLVLPGADARAGRDLGILNIAATLPQVLAPGLAWLVVTVTHEYGALFMVSLVLAALGAVAVLRVRSVR